MKSILVAIDDSNVANCALDYAIYLASKFSSKLIGSTARIILSASKRPVLLVR